MSCPWWDDDDDDKDVLRLPSVFEYKGKSHEGRIGKSHEKPKGKTKTHVAHKGVLAKGRNHNGKMQNQKQPQKCYERGYEKGYVRGYEKGYAHGYGMSSGGKYGTHAEYEVVHRSRYVESYCTDDSD